MRLDLTDSGSGDDVGVPAEQLLQQSELVVGVGERVMGEQRQLAGVLAHPQSQIDQSLRLIRQPIGGRVVELLQPDTGMLVVVDHDLMSAVRTAFEVARMCGMYPHQRVERL